MLSGITITCFTASYLVCFGLELTRLFFRAQVRTLLTMGFAVAGLFAHTVYLLQRALQEMTVERMFPLSSWYGFCLLVAWVLAGAYLGLAVRQPRNNVGLFVLPLVLAMIGLGMLVAGAESFSPLSGLNPWRVIHATALLLGTVAVTLGFATGLMYLIQANRLKKKIPPRRGLQLPSLEWLQRFNRESLIISTGLLGLGLMSGVILNLAGNAGSEPHIEWTDPVILSSGVLFVWLLTIVVFESVYKPARLGRKVAYLTLGSFVFLLLALGFVLSSEHATGAGSATGAKPESGEFVAWRQTP